MKEGSLRETLGCSIPVGSCDPLTYFNTRRAHMERDHLPPIREAPEEAPKLDRDQIVVRSYVGGLTGGEILSRRSCT